MGEEAEKMDFVEVVSQITVESGYRLIEEVLL